MKSINFEILRNNCPELASLGGFAEAYVYSDPSSSLVKLRLFVEHLVINVYNQHGLQREEQASLLDMMRSEDFKKDLPAVVLDKMHIIRKLGNKAAHGEQVNHAISMEMLKEAADLTNWFYLTYGDGSREECQPFREPLDISETKAQIKREKKAALQKLAAAEAQLQQLIDELYQERARAEVAQKETEEFKRIIERSRLVAKELHFNEETTRQRLIDTQLADAGWDIGSSGVDTDEVTQEHEVDHQPTDSGKGYADYVLWDDNGKPLAVIEAKKTSVDAERGRKQAELYADGLEKMFGQRPVIFCTNGFDIWIWDDAQGYPPRKLFGFYSKDSLQYLHFQRSMKVDLNTVKSHPEIANRLYQQEAIRQVCERFTDKHRNALIVQATGTGKTRVAISLSDILMRARWAKRILFLCDRTELRRQAKNAFGEFLNEPLTIVKADTAKDRNKRIYLATYPAMMKVFQTFDVGFFDLIIADESHRSIYNRYRDLFHYFDCFQVGLTATPVKFISRHTYSMFGCEEEVPTAYYPLERAVGEGNLVPYEVFTHTTQFLRMGIKYEQLTDEQKKQLEDDGENPELFHFEPQHIDKQIFNKDTNRLIIRNLMENGIKDATGQHPGKSIIFARNHKHAVLLEKLFNEMYPQYAGKFCQVIDNYDPRAEQLIDDFKGKGTNDDLTIAISVDMLDTGIDVLEIVNLVFAKPVFSLVKFQQMIGRGTRLCPDLFGPGEDKTIFRIFDHWGNFERFDQSYTDAEPNVMKPLMQRLFEARIALAETALNIAEVEKFNAIIELIQADIVSLPEESIAVREKWREKRTAGDPDTLRQFSPATVAVLRNTIAPLMQWVNIRKSTDAYEFDYLITTMQITLLQNTGQFPDLKDKLLNQVSQLQMHLNPVRQKAETIRLVLTEGFWNDITVEALESIRKELRGIMQYRLREPKGGAEYKTVDVTDGELQVAERVPTYNTNDMEAYKKRVEETLRELFDKDPTLCKIRAGEPVSKADLDGLTSLVLTKNPNVNLDVLKEFYSETAAPLDHIIRSIIGMEAEYVKKRFQDFVQKHPELDSDQVRFLGQLQNYISKYGAIEVTRLYEPPFTTLYEEGLDGAFSNEKHIDEIIHIIESFKPEHYGGTFQA